MHQYFVPAPLASPEAILAEFDQNAPLAPPELIHCADLSRFLVSK